MAIASGVAKLLKVKKETTWGVVASAAGSKLLRRVKSTLDLSKDSYSSAEIRSDYQRSDFRHGVRKVSGSINGELSAGTYADFFASILRKLFVVGGTTGAVATIAVSGTGTAFSRGSGSFITDGFKVGDVVSATGFVSANNNSHYALVTSVVALTMSVVTLDGVALTDVAAGATVTLACVGKKSYTPVTGHTDESYSIEHYYSDLSPTVSEVFTGVKVGSCSISLPPTGMAGVDFGLMGKDIITSASEYFTSPTAMTTSGDLAAVNGIAYAIGAKQTILTGANIKIDAGLSSEPVVGSNSVPAIFNGRVMIDGDISAYFSDVALRDAFLAETEVALMFVFTENNTKNPNFISFVMPRCKLNGATKDDGEAGLKQAIPFVALFNGAGSGADQTTLIIQDSLA